MIHIRHMTEVNTSMLDMELCSMLASVANTDINLLTVLSFGHTV